ncbi:hypothetical protein ACLMJK_000445 [Lecanora helva]
MADRQRGLTQDASDDAGSRISSTPLLGEGLKTAPEPTETQEIDARTGKRRFWNIGKKKEDDKAKKKRDGSSTVTASMSVPKTIRPPSPVPAAGSPIKQALTHPYGVPSSPNRNLNSSSPGVPSPASSQIFERSVQEDALAPTASPAIPSHITTENHIPAVLDASSEAITDDHLNPDNVEIVMHTAHQPAAVTVTGTGSTETAGTSLHDDDVVSQPDKDDAASSYGALDSNDVRRLSFISFADVVHAEHADPSGSIAPSISSPLASAAHNRSPSPVRSPISSQGLGGSPLISGSDSSRGQETSPNRLGRGPGSPFTGHSPPSGGELTIETMRQALRKTGSGDLSGARSQPMSASAGDDEMGGKSFRDA